MLHHFLCLLVIEIIFWQDSGIMLCLKEKIMTPHFSFNIEELNCVNEFVFYAGKILAIEFVFLKQVNLCVAKNCIVAPTS